MTISLLGPIPSKKSLYRRKANGGLYLDRKVRQILDGLQVQIQSQWNGKPVKHPTLLFRFTVENINQDRDGMLTTLLDLMQGVVFARDSIAQCNGTIILMPALQGEPGATVVVEIA